MGTVWVTFAAALAFDALRSHATEGITENSINISQVYSRYGYLSGPPPPDQVDEKVEIKIPARVVRKAPFEIDIVFYNESSLYLKGTTKRVRLIDVAGLSKIAKTKCEGVPTTGSLACIETEDFGKKLMTGWRVQVEDQERLDFVFDLTQAKGLPGGKDYGELTEDEIDRLIADEQTRLTIETKDQTFSVTMGQPTSTVGDVGIEFKSRRVTIKGIPVVSALGLTSIQETIFEWIISFIGFALGSGVAWRFTGKQGS